jgi:hypothetical protein
MSPIRMPPKFCLHAFKEAKSYEKCWRVNKTTNDCKQRTRKTPMMEDKGLFKTRKDNLLVDSNMSYFEEGRHQALSRM